MIRFALARLISLIVSALTASVLIFIVIEIVPGDPAAFMLGIEGQPEALAALRAELGLDTSKIERYAAWIGGLVQGDFGISYTYRTPVSELVGDRVWVSLPLAVYALILTVLIAFPAGVFAASRRGKIGDAAIMGATQLGVAIPNFWFALLAIMFFSFQLQLFPSGGFPGWEAGFWTGLHALTLPALSLALPQAAILARVMRSSLIDMIGEDFIRTARAKGLSRGQALWRHALRNALIPALTIIGLQFSFLLAGAIVVEQVFSLPGLGRLIFESIERRDLITVESTVMLLVFAVILVNFLVDLAYAAIDPRLRRNAA